MCTDPVLLCLDEPAAGLNPSESAELARYLAACCAIEHATSILLIEHDMSVVMEISDHVVVLDHGVKIADGPPERGAQRPEGDRRLSRRRGRRGQQGRGGGRAVTSLLSVRGVKTYYGNIAALKGVDVEVGDGEIVALIGANGAGKSTLMMTICGNPRAREGSITFAGRDITQTADPRDRAAADRAVAGRPPHLRAHDRAGKPADGRGHLRPRPFPRPISNGCSRCSRA